MWQIFVAENMSDKKFLMFKIVNLLMLYGYYYL